MAKQLQLRRGDTSDHGSFTGAVGEVTVDTDKKTVVVHDNSTAGGFPLARADGGTTITNFRSTGIDDNSNALAITIDSSERVGINAPSPAYKMDIRGTGNDTFQVMNGGGAYARIAPDSNGANADIRLDFAGGSGSETGVALIIRANGGEKFRVQGSGDTTIQGDLKVVTDKGINFYGGTDPDTINSASSASNTLKDYEEGTWTPTTGADGETVNRAKYIKIGNQVTIAFDLSITDGNAGSPQVLTGLPFLNPSDNLTYPVSIAYHNALATNVIYIVGQIGNNSSQMIFSGSASASNGITTSLGVFGTTARIIASGTYFTNDL
jgi:hypothetical protein